MVPTGMTHSKLSAPTVAPTISNRQLLVLAYLAIFLFAGLVASIAVEWLFIALLFVAVPAFAVAGLALIAAGRLE